MSFKALVMTLKPLLLPRRGQTAHCTGEQVVPASFLQRVVASGVAARARVPCPPGGPSSLRG